MLFSPAWCCAALICAASYGATLSGHMCPEDWPLTPFCLFAWNAAQWKTLFARFVHGRTRLVFATAEMAAAELVGLPVLSKWGIGDAGEFAAVDGPTPARASAAPAARAVYNAWEQCMGETLVYGPVLTALRREFDAMANAEWDAKRLTGALQAWLVSSQRLVERSSGRPLVATFWVQLDPTEEKVGKVLAIGA